MIAEWLRPGAAVERSLRDLLGDFMWRQESELSKQHEMVVTFTRMVQEAELAVLGQRHQVSRQIAAHVYHQALRERAEKDKAPPRVFIILDNWLEKISKTPS